MFCTKCGAQIKAGTKFCTQCGAAVAGAVEEKQNKGNYVSGSGAFGLNNAQGQAGWKQKDPSETRLLMVVAIVCGLFLVLAVSGTVFWLLGGKDLVMGSRPDKNDSVALDTEQEEDTAAGDGTLLDEQEGLFSDDWDIDSGFSDREDETDMEWLWEDEDEEPYVLDDGLEEDVYEYILPGSDRRFLARDDLEGFDADLCRIARNELYARHGRKFNDPALQGYFNSCSWYEGTIEADDFKESTLNDYEIANRDLIVDYEKEMGYR